MEAVEAVPPVSKMPLAAAPVPPISVVVADTETPATADATKAVVAIWVLVVPGDAVGAVGVPVSAGEAKGALAFTDVHRDLIS